MNKARLPSRIQKNIDGFLSSLKKIYGDHLISAILYGSVASGEYAKKVSNVNIAVVLDDASLANLAKAAPVVRKYRAIEPIFLTEEYISRSADVFPIEFLDMKENYILLCGRDAMDDISIDLKNLRFQCEQEIKAMVLNIKRAYLKGTGKANLRKLLFKYLTSSFHILRNMLRLKGQIPPYAKLDILRQASQQFNIDITNMSRMLEAKQKNANLGFKEIEEMFFALSDELEKIADLVDRL